MTAPTVVLIDHRCNICLAENSNGGLLCDDCAAEALRLLKMPEAEFDALARTELGSGMVGAE